ncbi:3-deoxy-D-manno-octulosonic acid transferase [Candidatus Pelagibacter sp.]|nr:3-deoxy-D-manno-octulosonic acid transferase [Candidatus Pelagibacter sp.]
MFFFYQILLSILLLISPVVILHRILINKESKERFLEKYSIFSKRKKKGKLIWFHGASVGEILSVIPLIEKYEKDKSIRQILVTSSTLSSSKVLESFKFKKTIHQFYIFDLLFLTSRFLDYWKPNIAIFIDSEIWPAMFKTLNKKNIPLLLLNARLTKKSFNKWYKYKFFSKSIFRLITKAYPQNLETNKFLKKLGVKKIKYIGNLKFCENYNDKRNEITSSLKNKFKNKKIWIASSTHSGEEIFCVKAHLELKKKIKNLITIIIPRHISRANEIMSEIAKFNLNTISHSSKSKNFKNIDIYLVDTFGETKKFFKIASTVFLGGSIIKRGGQNPLEAARYGTKILHGQNIDNFKDVYKLLNSLNISKKVSNYHELASSISFLRNQKIGLKISKIGKIILKNTLKEIDTQIKNEFKKT